MRKVKDYKILLHFDETSLEELVFNKIVQGWEPIGGLTIRQADYGRGIKSLFFQAIIKIEDI